MADQAKIDATDEGAGGAQAGSPSAGSAPARRKRFAVRNRRIKRLARRVFLSLKGLLGLVFSNLKGLPGLVLRVAGAIAVIVVVVLLVIELTRHQMEIQPISAPKSLAEAGYSPEVAAVRLRDAMGRLAAQAATAGGQALTISMRGEMPDIVVPTVGLSVSTLGAYLQHFFGYSSRTTIGGELTGSEQRFTLLLRLNGEVIFRSPEPVTMDRLDDVWAKAAEAVMLEISPYRALLALYNTNPEAAMSLAGKIIRRYPPNDENVAWARLVRGSDLLSFFQYGAAEREFREVLRQADAAGPRLYWNPFATPASYVAPAQFYLGVTLLNRGRAAEAYPELRKAVRLDPNDPGAHYYLGRAAQALKKTTEAGVEFATTWAIYRRSLAEEHGPKSARAHISFGSALQQQNNEEEGLAQLRWAVELDPGSDYAHGRFCDGLRRAKRLDEALTECRQAVSLGRQRAENQISLAKVLIDLNDLDGALPVATEALRLAPTSPFAHEALGMVHEKAARLDEAGAAYRAAANLAPEAGVFHNELGIVLFKREKFADAADAYRSAIALVPDDAVIHWNLAGALASIKNADGKIKEVDGAIKEYKTAISLDPGLPVCHNDLGNLYFQKKEFAAAAAAYAAAVALAPRVTLFHWNLAGALANNKDVDGAIREYKVAIGLDPNRADFHNRLGEVYFEKQDFAAAADAYRTAIKLNPKYSDPYYNLAAMLDNQADTAGSEASRIDLLGQACRLLTAGLIQVPDDPDMRRRLTTIAPKLPKSAGCEATAVAAPPG
jgi:tetratricopeptide (TPR) repeat protein